MAAIGRRRPRPAGIVAIIAALGLLLGGCYTVVYPNQPHMLEGPVLHEMPYVEPTSLGEYELCAFAVDAVRKIVTELWQAPDEAALILQTIKSYNAFAQTLRELAAKAEPGEQRRMIEAAAAAAAKYAAEVDRRNTYHNVDIDPTVEASKDAFPNCDLDR